eukprot:5144560-Amphidinium_carterae.4
MTSTLSTKAESHKFGPLATSGCSCTTACQVWCCYGTCLDVIAHRLRSCLGCCSWIVLMPLHCAHSCTGCFIGFCTVPVRTKSNASRLIDPFVKASANLFLVSTQSSACTTSDCTNSLSHATFTI